MTNLELKITKLKNKMLEKYHPSIVTRILNKQIKMGLLPQEASQYVSGKTKLSQNRKNSILLSSGYKCAVCSYDRWLEIERGSERVVCKRHNKNRKVRVIHRRA